MPKIGKCGLCLRQQDLQLSHLLPAALYRMTRDPDTNRKNRNPVLITRDITMTTSEQVREYFLCSECEQRFSAQGENYALSQVHNGKRFPLLEALYAIAPSNTVPARAETPEFRMYSEKDTPKINRTRLLYFCMSIFWRASAHLWKGLRPTELGPYGESIRKYLLGETAFPSRISVQLFVATDWLTQNTIFDPSTMKRFGPFKSHGFVTRGLVWWMHVGKQVPIDFYNICFETANKAIVVNDCEAKTLQVYTELGKTSRVALALQKEMSGRA